MSMPTDNGKEFFVKDFYRRTLMNLERYNGEYDVTFLINSMVGLLIVPKEKFFASEELLDRYVDAQILERVRSCIKKNLVDKEDNPNKSLEKIIRHLRNAVSHGRMTILGEMPVRKGELVPIGSINFIDKGKYKDNASKKWVYTYFEMEINVELLKEFCCTLMIFLT